MKWTALSDFIMRGEREEPRLMPTIMAGVIAWMGVKSIKTANSGGVWGKML